MPGIHIEPIVERIAADLLTTLATVTTNNSYFYDLTVERALRRGNQPKHLKAVLYQGDAQQEDTDALNFRRWKVPFEILVYIIPEETDTIVPDTYRNRIVADITKAVMVDINRSSLALDTEILADTGFNEVNGEFEGVIIPIEVDYRTAYNDPYQLS